MFIQLEKYKLAVRELAKYGFLVDKSALKNHKASLLKDSVVALVKVPKAFEKKTNKEIAYFPFLLSKLIKYHYLVKNHYSIDFHPNC